MKSLRFLVPGIFMLMLLFRTGLTAQEDPCLKKTDSLKQLVNDYRHRFDVLEKLVDDLLWYKKVEDLAWVDKLYLTGPPRWKEKSETARGAGNPLKYWCYVFIPRGLDYGKKHPLILLPHGGVHGNFETYYAHIVR
jgi:hypothetical protein